MAYLPGEMEISAIKSSKAGRGGGEASQKRWEKRPAAQAEELYVQRPWGRNIGSAARRPVRLEQREGARGRRGNWGSR